MCARDNKTVRGPRSEIQQLLNLLKDKDYVSRYRVCEDKVTNQDIFFSLPNSVKLFNTFLFVLIIDSIYKTNKYRLPLLEIVGVTSKKMTYLVGFAFLESEKENNVTWALEMCKTMLKEQENMSLVIITDRDNALMNSVATVFPTSSALLCKYHITKNVRSQVKPTVGTKQVNGKDRKMAKPGVVVEKIMNAWNGIISSSTKELYAEFVLHFKSVCAIYPDLLKYVKGATLGLVKEKIIYALTDQVRHFVTELNLHMLDWRIG